MHNTPKSKKVKDEFELFLSEVPEQIRSEVRDSLTGGHVKRAERRQYQRREYDKKQKYKRRSSRDPELNSDQIASWYRELKSTLVCAICFESTSECLVFHHIDPSTKNASISSMIRSVASKEDIINEMTLCTVLCHNCHVKKHLCMK